MELTVDLSLDITKKNVIELTSNFPHFGSEFKKMHFASVMDAILGGKKLKIPQTAIASCYFFTLFLLIQIKNFTSKCLTFQKKISSSQWPLWRVRSGVDHRPPAPSAAAPHSAAGRVHHIPQRWLWCQLQNGQVCHTSKFLGKVSKTPMLFNRWLKVFYWAPMEWFWKYEN